MAIDRSKIKNGRLTEGAYVQDESLTEVVIPEDVTDIGELAFYGCPNLRKVTFPKGLRYIREEAFGDTAVEEAILPAGLEVVGEKAFFGCGALRRIEVPGPRTEIGPDAFGCCDMLHEGYVARGYPAAARHHEELLYTLLWCSCPDRHSAGTSERAVAFINRYEELIMEWVIKFNNIPAMTGIAGRHLLKGNTGRYITEANLAGRSEITALLMSAPAPAAEGEFEL